MKPRISKIIARALTIIAPLIAATGIYSATLADSNISSSDFAVTSPSVELDGENDGTVSITFSGPTSGTLYALDGTWDTTVTSDSSTILTLASITPADGATSTGTTITNNTTTGQYMWIDLTVAGLSISDGNILTATYTVDKDTPSGTYDVEFYVDSIAYGSSADDTATGFTLTSTVTVSRVERTEYTATFSFDSNISSVEACTVQFSSDGTCSGTLTTLTSSSSSFDIAATDKSTGTPSLDGSDQLNFRITPADGYKVDSVAAAPTSGYKNIKGASDTGLDNTYRITKITDDLTVTIASAAQTVITPTFSIDDQSYTGSEIKISPTVTISGTSTTLTEDTDYTVAYSTTNDYTSVGSTITATITTKNTSNYYFSTPVSNSYNIVALELASSNVSGPTEMIVGNAVTSDDFVVTANDTTLIENTDYTISISGTDGSVGDTATVTITGMGNYTGTVTISVDIVDKYSQSISYATTEVSKEYGDANFTNALTETTVEGAITYASSDTSVATVDSSTGEVAIVAPGSATITATVAETSTYNSATASYTLTVSKKSLAVSSVTVDDKTYDGTTDATVSALTLSDSTLAFGTDFTATATFADADVAEDKTVTVVITLDSSIVSNYELASDSTTTTASITALELTSSNTSITWGATVFTYSGSENKPTVTVVATVNGSAIALEEDTDYTVTYSDDTINVGSKTAVLTGIGNYTGTFETLDYSVSQATVTPSIATIDDVTYNGVAQEPALTVTDSTFGALTLNTDYTVTYSDNTDVGTATAVLSPVSTSNYTFSENTYSGTFNIVAYTLSASDISLSYTTVRYDGTEKKPTITVSIDGAEIDSSNYSVSYASDTTSANAAVSVTITGLNNLTGTVEKTYAIVDKDTLTISGIYDQSVTYTGSAVELSGTLTVSGTNSVTSEAYDLSASDLTTTWYASDGATVIEQPTDVGSYIVKYTYSDDNCEGSLEVSVAITKASSGTPDEASTSFSVETGTALSDVALSTTGLTWDDNTTTVTKGSATYPATYIKNNDSTNYESVSVSISVYGLSRINVTTSVSGEGGSISDSVSNILEGTSVEITLTPETGYELTSLLIGSTEVVGSVSDNAYTFTAGDEDIEVIATFSVIQYTLTISGTNVTLDPSGVIEVNYNSSQSITITTKSGYQLTSVLVNDVEMIDSVEDNVITLSNILEDTTVVVTAEPIISTPNTGTSSTDKSSVVATILPTLSAVATSVATFIFFKKRQRKMNS